MDLIDRIGFDTIEKLEAAAPARLAEAIVLQTAGHHLAAIYLCGYAAEMWLGSAYFKILGYAPDQEVEASRRGAALKAAKLRKGQVACFAPARWMGTAFGGRETQAKTTGL
jgi:hypothetical protein